MLIIPFSAFFDLSELKFFRTFSFLKPLLLFNSNRLAIWYIFQLLNIDVIKVKNCRRAAIFNLIKVDFFRTFCSILMVFQLSHILKSKVAPGGPF